jgi:cell wall-associated NlpC family hydrolase
MPVNGTDIVSIARTWLDVPFRHQGRSRHGVDCGGLLLMVATDAGLSVAAPTVYSMSPDPDMIADTLQTNCTRLQFRDQHPGDVLLFSFAGEPRHVGIASELAGHPAVIHAWAKPGKVVEHRIDDLWHKRLRAVYRLRGLA